MMEYRKLTVGDKVMVISHGKLVGVSTVDHIASDTAFITYKGLGYNTTISTTANCQGFICMIDQWEYYLYNKETCDRRGFEYKEI